MYSLDNIISRKTQIKGYKISDRDADSLCKELLDNGSENQKLVEFLRSFTLKNFSGEEIYLLAGAIARTGKCINISEKIGPCVSKTSAGHVSDGVSLIVMSVLAALGVRTVKMTNSKFGTFGNTISKLAVFEGFNADVKHSKFLNICEQVGCAILENKGDVVPADFELKKILDSFNYPSIPLLAASLLSKKIAIGTSVVVYDVKSGEGGIVKTRDDAYKLGKTLVEVSKLAGIKAASVVTTLNQPVSASIGAMAELREVIRSLSSGEAYFDSDLMKVSKEIVEVAMILSGVVRGRDEAGEMFDDAVISGRAMSKFKEIVFAFGGAFESLTNNLSVLSGVHVSYVESLNSGYLADVDTAGLYESYKILSGEGTKNFDKEAGIVMLVREGAKVKAGEKIARVIYSLDNDNYPLALPTLHSALCVKEQKPKHEKVLVKVFV